MSLVLYAQSVGTRKEQTNKEREREKEKRFV